MSDRRAEEESVGQLHAIGIDVEDLDRSERFWSVILGLKVASRDGQYLAFERQGEGPTVYLQKVPEKKTGKTRVHLDVGVKDVNTALARVEALGGRKLRIVEESGMRWVVALDPDGTEFCLVPGEE